MVILVVGPSGVGKSDHGEEAARAIPGCQFYDLDSLVRKRTGTPVGQLLPKIGNDAFLNYCQQEVDALLQCQAEVIIVAVGAGALQSSKALSWILGHNGPTISIVAPPEEVYVRGGKRNENRILEDFISVEFSEGRQAIYGIAKNICSVSGLSLEEARIRFTALIRSFKDCQRSDSNA